VKVIVSSRFAVEVVDFHTDERHLIRTSDYNMLYYGITWHKDNMFLAKRYLNKGDAIEILDRNLDYVDTIGLSGVTDVHQILFHNGNLYVTSTGSNLIYIYDENLEEVDIWAPDPDFHGKDINHFNSLWMGIERAYVVAHNGGGSQIYAFDLLSRELIYIADIGMGSHNVYYHEGEVITLSSDDGYIVSSKGKVYNLNRNKYPRGLVVSDNHSIVGLSEHVTDRGLRHKERRGAVQLYNGFLGGATFVKEIELWHGMVLEVRGLDFPDKAHHGKPWTGLYGVVI
jgi:hypothetical protein